MAATPPPSPATGALFGLAVGDALVAAIEIPRFLSASDRNGRRGGFGLKPGERTDDTSMALCLADSLRSRLQRSLRSN